MSHHSTGNETYPEDGVSHYPQGKGKKGARKSKGLHNVANRLSGKAKALKKRMGEVGGRFTKPY